MTTRPTRGEHNPERARFCTACGTPPLIELVTGSEPRPDDPEALRNLPQAYGPGEARVRVGLGRCVLRLGRRDDALDELPRARAHAQDLGAELLTPEINRLLEGLPAR
jgi:hypothetical protein